MYNPILDVFMMVVKKGSFSKAAQYLFLTHTAVIKQMNTLEEQLQTQLFYRSHQGISLTPAGQLLYDETKHIMSLSQQIKKLIFIFPFLFVLVYQHFIPVSL